MNIYKTTVIDFICHMNVRISTDRCIFQILASEVSIWRADVWTAAEFLQLSPSWDECCRHYRSQCLWSRQRSYFEVIYGKRMKFSRETENGTWWILLSITRSTATEKWGGSIRIPSFISHWKEAPTTTCCYSSLRLLFSPFCVSSDFFGPPSGLTVTWRALVYLAKYGNGLFSAELGICGHSSVDVRSSDGHSGYA